MSASEFQTRRAQLQESRQQLQNTQGALFLAREKLKQVEAQQDALKRYFDPNNQTHAREQARLAAQHAETNKRITGLRGELEEVQSNFDLNLEAFGSLTDPRQLIESLSDMFPVLLLPLRIETRFKRFESPNGIRHELWVRVYPDDCAVDTFEGVLSETELRNMQTYWAQVWRAGDNEADRKAAWRNLVSSHGSGRALWLVEQYRPLNEGDQPARAEDTLILVIKTGTPLSAAEQTSLNTFWEAVWRAGDNAPARLAAQQALIAAVGAERAQELIKNYAPFNLSDGPPAGLSPVETTVIVATVVFETADATETKRRAWAKAPSVNVMPDRLVLLAYDGETLVSERLGNLIPSPLIVGPDPLAAADDQIRQEEDKLIVSSGMKWMVDFDEAVDRGMGFKIALTDEAQWQRGLDRLLVLGVRLSSDETEGQVNLEALLKNHQYSRKGLSVLPQGTATNNTEDKGADYSGSDNADLSFPLMSTDGGIWEFSDDWFKKADGQWLAEWLGVDPSLFQRVLHADQLDVSDAQAMNIALWSATIGYFMDTMMSKVFTDRGVDFTRQFFTRFVSGRGMLPALRIGQQPYGILPTSVYSRMQWPVRGDGENGPVGIGGIGIGPYLNKLHEILMRAHGVWGDLLNRVSFIGKDGDPHQILLDVLGLHPTSVEFYKRYAESLAQLINSLNLRGGFAGTFWKALLEAQFYNLGTDILHDHGYNVNRLGRPDLLDKYFFQNPYKLHGDLIDDQPLSETNPIRDYTPDGLNYIEWLATKARSSLEDIRLEESFIDNKPPTALLYLMLRHAILLGYYDTSRRFHIRAEALTDAELRATRVEPNFIHIAQGNNRVSESRWGLLYKKNSNITQGEDILIADYIPKVLDKADDAQLLRQQIEALERLQNRYTAQLERAFVEHLDTCSYRLDAWLQGLVQYQLSVMRFTGVNEGSVRRGLYLGAYGWLENVRREKNKILEPVTFDDEELSNIFTPEGEPSLLYDRTNAGYIHAPSLNHAVTAAVLRNGYLSNAERDNAGVFAINLSSERVRQAMTIIEGIHGGQSLGALLGYQFERGLHDRHKQAEVDVFIYGLRKVFPLRADRITDTVTPANVPIQTIEARNVLDGVALVEHVLATNQTEYPFGKPGMPPASPEQAAAMKAEVQRLLDTHDAVADIGIAEGVHQVVQGNYDRAAASLDAFSKGELPPVPDVVQTPRSGIGLTHRVGLHLQPGLSETASPHIGLAVTPRASAEPALNHWLASIMPDPDNVEVSACFEDGTGANGEKTFTQADLNLQPIDLLYMLNPESGQDMSALDDLILLRTLTDLRPDAAVTIQYTKRSTSKISFFELGSMMSHLRALLLQARPLRATDMALPNEADETVSPLPDYHTNRLTHVRDELTAPLAVLQALAAELTPLLADPAANVDDLVDNIDDRLARYVATLVQLRLFGLPQTGFSTALAWKRNRYTVLLTKVEDLLARWQGRLDEYDALLAAYNALPLATNDEVRFEKLSTIEALVAIVLTSPLPPSPLAYLGIINGRRTNFENKRADFAAILNTATPDLSTLTDTIKTTASNLDQFDFVRLNLEEDVAAMVLFCQDTLTNIRNIVKDIEKRITMVNDDLAAYAAAGNASARTAAFTHAAQTLLGEDFLVVPEFTLNPTQADELNKAVNAKALLLTHIKSTGVDFPEDDWLYGAARVRTRLRNWEAVTMLADALAGAELDLHPTQLPFQDNDSWLALPYPADYTHNNDRLLYTAHFSVAFNKSASQCGLLLDEWTEVIPTDEETTGIAFHYDRPNSEPPQVMLLVAPPVINGKWEWADLVATLHETLELAKRRAVEPDHIDSTPYACYLPATISAATFQPITIALNLALNNNVLLSPLNTGGSHG
jgi:hypothetical protein